MIGASALAVAGAAAANERSAGRDIYNRSCIACHGFDGAGAMAEVPDLTAPDGPMLRPDAVLLRSIIDGVDKPGAPLAMPPMGGDPELTEAGARQVLEFIRAGFGPGCAGAGPCGSSTKE